MKLVTRGAWRLVLSEHVASQRNGRVRIKTSLNQRRRGKGVDSEVTCASSLLNSRVDSKLVRLRTGNF